MSTDQSLPTNSPEYWMSLEQFAGSPDFAARAEREFLSSPLAEGDASSSGLARRDFLKLMGASLAMTTAACVRRPAGHIIPYAKAPVDIVPGEPNYYTSTWFDGVEAAGVIVKTHEGRPIKFEGNPEHPMNRGGLSARAHAEILSLYDPDRLKGPVRNLLNKARTNRETIPATWSDADAAVLAQLKKAPVALITRTLPSPSLRAAIEEFLKVYKGRWVQYDPIPYSSVRSAEARVFGKGTVARYRFDRTRMVVSIDTDFLGTYLSPAEFTRDWATTRKPGPEMSRLVVFESVPSVTGMNADDRVRIRPSQQVEVLLALLGQIAQASKDTGARAISLPSGVAERAQAALAKVTSLGVSTELLTRTARELVAARGSGLIVVGGSLGTATAQQQDLLSLAALANTLLENDGSTVAYDQRPFELGLGSFEELKGLISELSAGKYGTVLIEGLDLASTLPAEAGLEEALNKVPLVVSLNNFNDASGRLAHYVLPTGSPLESWGDWQFQAGVYSLQQPTIRPMYETRSLGENLLAWGQGAASVPASFKDIQWYDFIRNQWKTKVQPNIPDHRGTEFTEFWNAALEKGVVESATRNASASKPRSASGSNLHLSDVASVPEGYELSLYNSVQLGDGSYSNVPWLQELPDPVSKVVWDNYAAFSPAAAKKENLKTGQIVRLQSGKASIELPVLVLPGVHDHVIGVAVGYGRSGAGRVAEGVGQNAYRLASVRGNQLISAGVPVTFQTTGRKTDVVSTQDHHSMEGRPIVIEATNSAYQKDPKSGIHQHSIFSIWPQHNYSKNKWAMTIDLNTCTGCSACVVACQSENNIQVVGKRYVMEGREMHWIRVDRYFKGDPANPDFAVMPLLCMQCENAPCETVCPVQATAHNDEGLNDMSYNRCVGTRYCANNCPYKVRRFNWFNFAKKREAPLDMAYNPDVTVRPRGVMEKCTFCVQRIRHGAGIAKDENRPVRDGDIKTACQESCPAEAIVFGDLNDPTSKISKTFAERRSYGLLEDLNTAPRVRYLTHIRNGERAGDHGHRAETHKG